MAKSNLSLAGQGLNYKLKISFYLIFVLPLLVCVYLLSNYILPETGFKLDTMVYTLITIIPISIVISISGFFLIKGAFDRIAYVTSEAKLIASGDIRRKLKVEQPDEVGVLGDTLNQLTQRIRSNMDELKSYSEKTTEINIQIQEQAVLLSSLLQISSLISQGARLEDILRIAVEKSRLLAKSEVAYLLFQEESRENFYMKASDGIDAQYLLKINISPKEDLFKKVINVNKPLVIDQHNLLPENLATVFYEKFKLKNNLALPVQLSGRVMAILGIGNKSESFSYSKQDIEMLDIFAKQIAIAVENDILTHRVEKLEIRDPLTDLYNEAFIRNRLQEEIKRAITYQRPCAFIILDIDNFKKFHHDFGSLQAENVLKRIAYLIRDSVTEIDRVGRISDDKFAILLPEKNKRRAQEIAEDIRKKIEFSFSEEPDINKRITVSGGVSENPLDGIDAEGLIARARDLVNIAKKQGRNRIADYKGP